jgi:hypothetical protein
VSRMAVHGHGGGRRVHVTAATNGCALSVRVRQARGPGQVGTVLGDASKSFRQPSSRTSWFLRGEEMSRPIF